MKILKFILISFVVLFTLCVLIIVFNLTTKSKPKIISKERTEIYYPFESNNVLNIDSIFNIYFNTDTFPLILAKEKNNDTVGILKNIQFLDDDNQVFSQECFNNFMVDDQDWDTSSCKEFDYFRDWRAVEGIEGIYLDNFKTKNGKRVVTFTHGEGCSCCTEMKVMFKSVKYHPLDDPRSVLDNYHSSNISLSGAEEEWLREDIEAISIFIKEIDSTSIKIKKLENSKYDSTYKDVFIVEKTVKFY